MNPLSWPAVRLILSLLGLLGTLLCVAGGLGVWYVERRIDRAQEHVFERIDQSFTTIKSRLADTENLVSQSKITLEEVQQRTRDWTKKEVVDRVADRFEVGSRAQQLTAGLRQADLMLDVSHETIQHIRQVLELGAELGFSLDADSVDPLLERITEFKQDLSHAIDTAESLRQRFDDDSDDDSAATRAQQVATIAARLLTTFGNVDARIASLRGRLNDAQHVIQGVNAKTRVRLVAVAVCTTLFLLWMAAGQLCLYRWGRNR